MIDIKNEYYKAYDERYRVNHEKEILWETTLHTKEIFDVITGYGINKNSKILEIGCGEGRDAIKLLNSGYNVLAFDYSKEAIKMCNKLTDNKYTDSFRSFDLFNDEIDIKFNFICSISVLHMFVLDEHRNKFFKFIREHLVDGGIGFISVMGDGIREYTSDINDAFKLSKRTNINTNKEINVASTSCRIVNWNKLIDEIENNDLKIIRKWISKDIPGFSSSMCVLVRK